MCVKASPKKSWTHSSKSINAFVKLMQFVTEFIRKPRTHLVRLSKDFIQRWMKCFGCPKQQAI